MKLKARCTLLIFSMRRAFVTGLVTVFGIALVTRAASPAKGEMGTTQSTSTARAPGGEMLALAGEDVGLATTAFGLKLFSLLTEEETNVFISPLSIASSLALVSLGSTQGSNSMVELETLLGFPAGDEKRSAAFGTLMRELGTADSSVALTTANSVWTRSSILDQYKETAAAVYDAVAQPLPSSPDPINAWVSKKTNGLISQLLTKIDPLTVAVLVNAVYFKGIWTKQFDPKKTTNGTFRLSSGDTAPCRLMKLKEKGLLYGELAPGGGHGGAEGTQLLELPYGKGDRFASVFMLPPEGSEEGVAGLAKALGAGPGVWQQWSAAMNAQEVEVVMPRFKMEYGAKSLKEALAALGLADTFDGSNGFLRMSKDPDVHLSDVFHKAVVEVSEEGTEAAAATAAVMMTRSMPRPSAFKRMVLDRPFVMAIKDRSTGMVLFVGRIDSPEFTGLEGGGNSEL